MKVGVLLLICLVIIGCDSLLGVGAANVIKINDPNWYFTEYNWFKAGDSSYARTVNPGAYFKVGFTGTSASLTILKPTLGSSFMNLLWSVDGLPYKQVTLPASSETIPLAQGLAAGNHNIVLYVLNSIQSNDRWYTPQVSVAVTGLILDDGAKTLAPALEKARVMAFWDSIGEGVLNIKSGGGDLTDNDSTKSSLMVLGAALRAEISFVAFGAQGYTRTGSGGVVPVFTPGNDTLSAWNKFYDKTSRLGPNGQLDPNPDIIVCGHGTNDNSAPADVVQKAALGWITAQRQASPKSWIFAVVPYGGFQRAAVTNAVNSFRQATGDKKVVLIDLGADAAEGIAFAGHATAFAVDGLHPTATRNGQLGALLAVAISEAIITSS